MADVSESREHRAGPAAAPATPAEEEAPAKGAAPPEAARGGPADGAGTGGAAEAENDASAGDGGGEGGNGGNGGNGGDSENGAAADAGADADAEAAPPRSPRSPVGGRIAAMHAKIASEHDKDRPTPRAASPSRRLPQHLLRVGSGDAKSDARDPPERKPSGGDKIAALKAKMGAAPIPVQAGGPRAPVASVKIAALKAQMGGNAAIPVAALRPGARLPPRAKGSGAERQESREIDHSVALSKATVPTDRRPPTRKKAQGLPQAPKSLDEDVAAAAADEGAAGGSCCTLS